MEEKPKTKKDKKKKKAQDVEDLEKVKKYLKECPKFEHPALRSEILPQFSTILKLF